MLFGIAYADIAIAAAIFVGSTLVTTAIVVAFLVSITADHFIAAERGLLRRFRNPISRRIAAIAQGIVGIALILVGIVLSLPGVPGQGLLTILVGILLIEVPGKRRLELRLVRRPTIRRTIDRIRKRFGKETLVLDQDPETTSRVVHDAFSSGEGANQQGADGEGDA